MSYVDKPQQVWWRRLFFQVHLWTGLGVGLYIFVISLSGAALVFREEIRRASEKRPVSQELGEPLGFDGLKEAAEEAFPEHRISWIRNRENPREAVEVWLEREAEREILLFDPVSGNLLGPKENGVGAALQWLADLHIHLLAGDTGMLVNGVGGGFLTLMALTGAVIWWPGVKNWRRSLIINPKKKWKRLNWDLHSAIGFWTLAFVLVWGVTGVYFAFPDPFRTFIGTFASFQQFQPRPKAEVPADGRILPVSVLVAAAERATPGKVSTWIGLPRREEDPWAQIYRKDSFEEGGPLSGVIVNAFSGEVQQVRNFESPTLGDKILRWFGYLHFGNFGGAPVKGLWTLFGLAPAFLFLSGSLMWWNRFLSKRLRAKKVDRAR